MRSGYNDATLFIALLSLVATQLSMLRNGEIDQLALKLQNKEIRLQAQSCQEGSPDDARIISALAIMSNHMAAGNPRMMAPHMKAIAGFVQQRGGLQYLGMDGIVADNLMFADHTRAITYNTRPSYQMPLPSLQLSASSLPSKRLGKGFHTLEESLGLGDAVMSALSDMSLLTDIYDRAAKKEATNKEATYFAYLASVVEYQTAELNATYNETGTLQELFTLALLLINHTIYRNYGNVTPIMPLLESRFWRCFRQVRNQGVLNVRELRDLELWFAFTGTISETRRKCPFLDNAVEVLASERRKRPYLTYDYIRTRALDPYIWSAAVQDHVFQKLWQFVEEGTPYVVKDESPQEKD